MTYLAKRLLVVLGAAIGLFAANMAPASAWTGTQPTCVWLSSTEQGCVNIVYQYSSSAGVEEFYSTGMETSSVKTTQLEVYEVASQYEVLPTGQWFTENISSAAQIAKGYSSILGVDGILDCLGNSNVWRAQVTFWWTPKGGTKHTKVVNGAGWALPGCASGPG